MASLLDSMRRLLALAQTGDHYTEGPYDRERYTEIAQIAADVIAQHSGVSARQVLDTWLVEGGYATPKLDVRAAIFRDDHVLLVQERADAKWTLPGGWADVNDSPSEAVLKEIEQESGYTARLVKLAALYDARRHRPSDYLYHVWKCFFIAQITGGQPRPSYETLAVDFFALDALPELSTARATEAQIRRMYEHHLNPKRPTEFD